MITGMGSFDGNQVGPRKRPIATSATPAQAPTNYRTPEGKAAKTFVGGLDKMSFDANTFSYLVASEGGNSLRRRILDVAIGIIRHYATEWETGVSQDEVSRDSMRLLDTIRQFNM
jgi:hypothetical protein